MKLPLSWLLQHLDADLNVDGLVDVMSMHGLEVEGVTRPGAGTAGVRTARVLDVRDHPDADNLRLVRVTGTDADDELDVVCGAHNFAADDIVLHAPPGATIPGMTLESREIRGQVSHGMLCSARELQLGDDHAGIIVLDASTPVGVDLGALIPVGEPVIEVAVQADRGDHWGVVGVARDLAAILDTTWYDVDVPEALAAPAMDVRLETQGCERFATWLVDDVKVGPSPLWMRQRLAQCGIRAIDIVVDVTNYVMLETGQPLHAFDRDTLQGSLTVRAARAGEQLTTLDNVERTLHVGDLVITDDARIVSLAGVMGGRDTEVRAATRSVLLEGAVWNPRAIRAAARRLGLVSEASLRFERRVDPEGAERATAHAAKLLAEHAAGHLNGTSLVRAATDPSWTERSVVAIDPVRVARLLGVSQLDTGEQQKLLERSGCAVDATADGLAVTPPSWRGDLQREADLAEEIARLHGYDRIPTEMPDVRVRGGLTFAQRRVRAARDAALALGFSEAVTRPFVGDGALVALLPSDRRLALANPLAKDAAALRPSLAEGLLAALRRNAGQGRPGTMLVEIGRIFRPEGDQLADALDAVSDADWRWRDPDGAPLPVQPLAIGFAAHGLRVGDRWLDTEARVDVFDVLAAIDEVVARIRRDVVLERRPVERAGFHPGQSAQLLLGGHEIGFVGALHPHEAERRDLAEPVIVGELLLDPLIATAPHAPATARTIRRHPALTVDVALVAPDTVSFAQIETAIRSGVGELLDAWWWFDEYRGPQVGEGNRSLAIRLRLHDDERQLTDDDAEQVIARVAEHAQGIGATLRR
ncbi:MAG: phenylalanine--tRNA ligase subunit beta [Nitriliruptoraceae bacterium]